MSSSSLHDKLLQAIEHLQTTLSSDTSNNITDPQNCYTLINEYLQVYSLLEECYDQTIQTQRRLIIRKLLQGVVQRFLEVLKMTPRPPPPPMPDSSTKKNPDPSDWELISQWIMSQTLVNDIRIPLPRIVKDEQIDRFKIREDLISKYKRQFDEARAAAEMSNPPPMPLEEAVLIIQRAERARQARQETLLKKGVQQQHNSMSRQAKLSDREKSANIIKRFWWKYGQRNKETKLRDEERELIGMKAKPKSQEMKERVIKNMNRRKEEQRKRRQELDAAQNVTKNWLEDNKAIDERRKFDMLNSAFYNRIKLKTGKAPTIKPKDDLIEKLIYDDEEEDIGIDPVIQGFYEKKKEQEALKNADGKKDGKSGSNKGGKKETSISSVPQVVEQLLNDVKQFESIWASEGNTMSGDEYSIDLVRKEMWNTMVPDLVKQCNDKLKRELKNLKILEMRRVRMPREPKPPRERIPKEPPKTDEEILSELVGYGIVTNCPTTSFADFVGDYNVTHPGDFGDPDPTTSYASIRNEVMMSAVMPFSANRETATDLPRGVLILGAKGTGKTTLAKAAVQALGATLIDFSPSVLVGKELPAPKALITMIMRIAKINAPTVILIDDIEGMFGNRKKANSSKKFKAQLRRNVRKIKARENILLIATSSMFNLPKACTSMFDKTITIPKPNFQTRVSIWTHWLSKKGLLIPSISINSLAFASEDFTGASIARACNKAETVKKSRTEPIDPIEDKEILLFLAEAPEEEWK